MSETDANRIFRASGSLAAAVSRLPERLFPQVRLTIS